MDCTYPGRLTLARVARMQEARISNVARISAERSTAAGLDDVFRWLVEHQGMAMRLDVDEVPALGQPSWPANAFSRATSVSWPTRPVLKPG